MQSIWNGRLVVPVHMEMELAHLRENIVEIVDVLQVYNNTEVQEEILELVEKFNTNIDLILLQIHTELEEEENG